jgi:hypothetical protein
MDRSRVELMAGRLQLESMVQERMDAWVALYQMFDPTLTPFILRSI